jgi:hydrogenase expression/formation protein HypE
VNSGAAIRQRSGKVAVDQVTLAHGSGGKAMRDLIDDVFVGSFANPLLAPLEDQARLSLSTLFGKGDRLAFTTDSYVVDPLFFPGGDIGKLAVCGTVNDLAVGGAVPLYLSSAMIIEEGFPVDDLRRIAASMQAAAREAGVQIVTGDTKVVHKGACDKLFINTSGVGVIPTGYELGAGEARPGDLVLVNGLLGDHGAAILNARGDMALATPIESDCASLNGLIADMLQVCPNIRTMRDATRGGIASVLNEIAQQSGVGVMIEETAIPMRPEVKAFCEILGLDPLYLANEGKLVAIVPRKAGDDVLGAMRAHELGADAEIIGEITETPAKTVVMKTGFGGQRVVDMLVGDQLPRIC